MSFKRGLFIIALLLTSSSCASATELKGTTWVEPACSAAAGKEGAVGSLLAGLFLEPVVKMGVGALADALKKAGEPTETSITSFVSFELYHVTTKQNGAESEMINRCILGGVGGPGAIMPAKLLDNWINALSPQRIKKLQDEGIIILTTPKDPNSKVSHVPTLYFELKPTFSRDQSAFQLAFERLWLMEGLSGKPTKAKDLVMTVSFISPSPKGDSNIEALRTFVLTGVDRLQPLAGSELNRYTTDWIPVPPVSKMLAERVAASVQRKIDLATNEALVKSLDKEVKEISTKPALKEDESKKLAADNKLLDAAKVANDQLVQAIKQDDLFLTAVAPYTIRVDVKETVDGNKFAAKLSQILSGQTDAITKAVVDRVDLTKRDATRATSLAADLAAIDVESGARVKAIEAVAAWELTKQPGKTDSERRAAEIKAVAACQQLVARGFSDISCLSLPTH